MITCQHLQWGPAARPLTPPLDVHLPTGSLTAVIGGNGCGKSSLLKCIAGLQRPLAGSLKVEARTGGIGYLVQQQAIDRQFPISLGELVSGGFWGSRLSRVERRVRLGRALDDWRLDGLESRHLQALSGGELQRALLARLSLTEAPLLLLDEPDASLDEASQTLLWQQMLQWHHQGRTLVLVCHDLAAVRERIDQCLLIAPEGCRLDQSTHLIAGASLRKVA
ncbi:metal ABC transporter ATP-binding protein [Pseudomonas sp. TE3610]